MTAHRHAAHVFTLRFVEKTQTRGRRPIAGPDEIQRKDQEPYKDREARPRGEMSELLIRRIGH